MRDKLIRMAAAAVGGVVATYVMRRAMGMSGKMPAQMRPPAPTQDPGHFMVKQAEKLVGRFSPKMHSGAAKSLHWVYGLTGPLVLGALATTLDLRSVRKTLLAGAVMGAINWAAGFAGWLPATGLTPPPHRVPLGKSASGLATHVAYGALASLPLALVAPRFTA
ncbi:MAG: hypothetical protein JWN44_2150 [Myxococcales bacterium]|nr:hypothetical protein [Myxococcales bacterium]